MLVCQQTDLATSLLCLSVQAAGNAGLAAPLAAAKRRSMVALNGLRWHRRRASMRALMIMDRQRLPRVIEWPLRLMLHNNRLRFELHFNKSTDFTLPHQLNHAHGNL